MSGKVRVVVVDDSLSVRRHVVDALRADPGIEVVGEASDGETAVQLCKVLKPHVMTMDMVLPKMDGLQATEQIMAHHPTPILIVSSSVNRGELFKTYDALKAGAAEVLEKPTGDEPEGEWEAKLISTVKLLSRIKVITHVRARLQGVTPSRQHTPKQLPDAAGQSPQLVAIGASTGGPGALVEVLRGLPMPCPVPVVVVLHIAELFGTVFAEWLNRQTPHPVKNAVSGAVLTKGEVLMAPPNRHLVVDEGGFARLTNDPERHSCKPSVDTLFESVAGSYGPRAVGALLTGMGRDGASGLLAMKQRGAFTIAQDEASSVIYGMPREAMLMGAASRVLPLAEIGRAISGALLTVERNGG